MLTCTTEGDGRVTYASGRLPGVRTWYMEAVHGDLASHRPGIPALQDLLDTGTTSRLSTAPPSTTRGGAVEYRALPEPVLYPTETSLAAGILGKTARSSYQQRPAAELPGIGGPRRSALRALSHRGRALRGRHHHRRGGQHRPADARSARRNAMRSDLYPGEFGSLAVILRKRTALQKALRLPSGAIVMGLGKWGELSAGQLSDLLRRAALQYVLERRDGLAASRG